MHERAASLLFTCEHACNRIPARYLSVARAAGKVLDTHRGFDPGALELARRLAKAFDAPLFTGKWSRLLIELNRSLHHRHLFSEFSRELGNDDKDRLITGYYLPYRRAVEKWIVDQIEGGACVLHVGVHSFTPVLDGKVRTADIGFLYDPRRPRERELCRRWADAVHSRDAQAGVRMNYPYRGSDDGFTTALRKIFGENDYLGVEIEVNQRFPLGPKSEWNALQLLLVKSLRSIWMPTR